MPTYFTLPGTLYTGRLVRLGYPFKGVEWPHRCPRGSPLSDTTRH